MPPFQSQPDAYRDAFTETYLPDEAYEALDLILPDDKLNKMLVQSLDADVDYWNQAPWNLQSVDVENVRFFLGDQIRDKVYLNRDTPYIDNRLFAATRAILSYATGQLAKPEITPSRSDETFEKMARSIQQALYQHSADEYVEQKVKAAVTNLIVRKRGYMKLRYDPNQGTYGDIITENCNPEDIIISRTAKFMDNPDKIYHRVRCSVEELCARFPNKEADIKMAFGIKQGRYSQMSRFVTYFECWFSYYDDKRVPREAVCWFLPEHNLILDKMPNPNWVYTGDDAEDKQQNLMFVPPKPFIWFNYINLGHSFIDETCLFEQAKPQQIMLNKRGQQIWDNADYVNGRWIANKKAMSEDDAVKIINKGAKTVALVNSEDVTKAFANISSPDLPSYVYNTLMDARNEIDTMMGTPAIFRGEQPSSQDTLGRDLMVKQQAGALQDDLVRAVALGMERYYKVKLQMMRTYYTDDYWFQVKGGDGKFDFIMLNGDNIDANVKVGVQVDSTLPLDKESIRVTALQLSQKNPNVGIDQLTLMEDLGMPDPEIRTERFLKSQLEPQVYLKSIEQNLDNNDAEIDIMLLTAGKEPEERDDYDEGYLGYFNMFIASNRFAKLPQDAQQRITTFLIAVQHIATESANLQATALDDAGMLDTPPVAPTVPGQPLVPGQPSTAATPAPMVQ